MALDEFYWSENWKPMELSSFRELSRQLAEKKEWVMDGNFGVSFQERWSRADQVIYLSPSVWICILRQILRAIHLLPRINRPKDCKERFNHQLFWYTYKFPNAHGHLIEKKMREQFPHLSFLKVTSYKEALEKLSLS